MSDSYEIQEDSVDLELKVLMLNINPGHNLKLMQECKTLRDYVAYVDKVRTYTKLMSLEDAVEKAIEECIEDDILADFLREHRAEARNVSIFEYDEELHMKQIREEGKEEALELASHILKSVQTHSNVTNEELAADCQITIEEVENLHTKFGL